MADTAGENQDGEAAATLPTLPAYSRSKAQRSNLPRPKDLLLPEDLLDLVDLLLNFAAKVFVFAFYNSYRPFIPHDDDPFGAVIVVHE